MFQLITENSPDAVKTGDIKNHFGRKVAIDASMSIYSFLIAVRFLAGVGLGGACGAIGALRKELRVTL